MSSGARILFVSDQDRLRGPLAAVLMEAWDSSLPIQAHSAGLSAGTPLKSGAWPEDLSGNLSNHEPRSIEAVMGEAYDVIITLSPAAWQHCAPQQDAATLVGEGVPDPASRLRAGAPIYLRWELPESKGAGQPSSSQAARLRADLQRQLDALLGPGTLMALLRQRQRLDALADLMSEGVIAHDAQRRIYLFNRAAERLTGQRRQDVLGQDCHQLFPPHGICGAHCAYKTGQAPCLEERHNEVLHTAVGGEQRQLELTSTPIPAADGSPGDVLTVIHDVTEVTALRGALQEQRRFHGMVGISAPVQEVFQTIRQVAGSDYPVLIAGESGTGKELVASAIHAESTRQGGPFVPVNCGALPESILESELFGHVRGAFTGAIRDKKGRFELAHQGTLFLDEVGELTPAFQVKLLRVLQEQRFERVGGEKVIEVDVRIIAASNRDLREMVADGLFREDLFYRLSVVPMKLPPLRARREDFPLLVNHILENIAKQTGHKLISVSHAVLDQLLQHQWPGNIRELINALQFASVRSAGKRIDLVHLPPEIRRADFSLVKRPESTTDAPGPGPGPAPASFVSPGSAAPEPARSGRRRKLDAITVHQALEQTGGNRTEAARVLGVGRATLYRHLAKFPPPEKN